MDYKKYMLEVVEIYRNPDYDGTHTLYLLGKVVRRFELEQRPTTGAVDLGDSAALEVDSTPSSLGGSRSTQKKAKCRS